MLHDILEEGVRRGEIRADLDKVLAIEILRAVYAWNYRLAAADAGTADASVMSATMDRQIQVIVEGWRPL